MNLHTVRPNRNPVLDMMRDDDMGDPWGTAMGWGFAVCEALAAAEEWHRIPADIGYRPSMAGPLADPDDHPTSYLLEHYGQPRALTDDEQTDYLAGHTSYARATETEEGVTVLDFTEDQLTELETAAKCLTRYLDWCKRAGRDY